MKINEIETENQRLIDGQNEDKQKQKKLDSNLTDIMKENERLKEQNERFNQNIGDLKEEVQALQNEVNKNKARQRLSKYNENEDKLIEKLQDTWQILYHELQPEQQNFDDTEAIKEAFRKWKAKKLQEYKEVMDSNESKQEEQESEYYDYGNQLGLSSLMIFLKDF